MKKKMLCALLAMCIAVSNIIPVFAVETKGERTLLDSYSAEHYEIATYQEGEMLYVITLMASGQVELVAIEPGYGARSIWFDASAVGEEERDLTSVCFVDAVIEYGADRSEESVLVVGDSNSGQNLDEESFVQEPVSVNNYHKADYDKLIGKLRGVYGSEHTNFNWTGMSSQSYGGLTYNYKENLAYDMLYRDYVAYSAGLSLGSFVAKVGVKLGFTPKLAVLAAVLGLSASATAKLPGDGILASYGGDVVYCRFVMIQGGGPYYQCYKTTVYNGWVNRAEDTGEVVVSLEHVQLRYSATAEIFDDYTMQRSLAYENYA